MLRVFVAFVAGFVVVGLAGCVGTGPYRAKAEKPKFDVESMSAVADDHVRAGEFSAAPGEEGLSFVEFDEFGNFFSRKQLSDALGRAKTASQAGSTILVFVHGWHHDARPGDSNVRSFNELVSKVRKASGSKALGIYVGWRGETIDSNYAIADVASMLLTFWGRKDAAHSVGYGGGVSELISELASIRAQNPSSRLVIMGHSFGGVVLYSSVAQLLQQGIASDSTTPFGGNSEISQVADTVILLNPALEAMKLRPLYEMAQAREFAQKKAPRLVILTTTGDWATRYTFPVGRSISTIFDRHDLRESRSQNLTAIGHYVPYVTHQLTPDECQPQTSVKLAENLDMAELCFQGADKRLLLKRCDVAGDCLKISGPSHFIPKRSAGATGLISTRFPIMNIRTTNAVVEGHNGIWGESVQSFITQLTTVAIEEPGRLPMAPR